jgi:AraC family transcriptional regulator
MSMPPHATTAVSRPPVDAAADLPRSRRRADRYAVEHLDRDLLRVDFDAITPGIEFSPAEIVRRRAVTWDGMAAEVVHATRRCRIECRFRAPVHMLVLFEAGERSDGFTFVEGLPRSTLRDYKRKLIFVPAGHEFYDWQEPRSLARAAHFYFDPAALPVEPDLSIADMSFAPRLFFEDAALWDAAIKLKALIEGPREADRLYREAIGNVLAHELVRFNLGSRRARTPVRGGLATWQQRAVAAYIEDHLAQQISLSTLAQLVRLSPFHFGRAFKQSFGVPPHRFHTHRRVEHAKSLLANPTVSVTDIGATLGFSATSSFTSTFRKVTGLTPTAYQRSLA